jgi:4-diphosphocytidyl-2-C-methyl-D-erythritol kinase
MVEALRRRNAVSVAANLYNGLEPVVEAEYPVVGQMKAALVNAGALGAVMSGSGPTVFGVARSLDQARQIRARVARASWACWSVRTVAGSAIRFLRASRRQAGGDGRTAGRRGAPTWPSEARR